VISALVGLSLIVGNALVAPLSRLVRTRTGLLMLSRRQAVLAVACGLLTTFSWSYRCTCYTAWPSGSRCP